MNKEKTNNNLIFETSVTDQCISLSELERVLPISTYKRIVKNLMHDQGYVTLTEFAKQMNLSKQYISHIINKEVNNNLGCPIEIVKTDKFVYIKSL